jgi:hypothetical protein
MMLPTKELVSLGQLGLQFIADAFKELQETRQLYQRVEVKIPVGVLPQLSPAQQEIIQNTFNEFWIPKQLSPNSTAGQGQPLPHSLHGELIIQLHNLRLHCSTCQRDEPHNQYVDPAHGIISFANYNKPRPQVNPGTPQQLFTLGYQCQSCRGEPVVFAVRRDGLKLILVGRSPIASFSVPNSIPKGVRNFYQRARIAHVAGQTLPGLFMLRTTIEQHARQSVGESQNILRGDELMGAYGKSLPDQFNSQYPSFAQLYSDLSVALHQAQDDDALFESACERIELHFEGQKLVERLRKLQPPKA